tara:strand:+ start:285 stop:401 length:117 start_codon:yes stop_codon:yes gene_type:complete
MIFPSLPANSSRIFPALSGIGTTLISGELSLAAQFFYI